MFVSADGVSMLGQGVQTATVSDEMAREFRFYNLQPDGALRPGGPLPLWSRDGAGLLLTYATVGVLYGALPSLIQPFFQSYLQLPANQVQTARAVLDAPWLWKVVGGALSDGVPLWGYRRKSYMALGWVVSFVALAFLGIMAVPPHTEGDIASSYTKTRGWLFIAGMGVATVGALFANVAADGLMIEWAQREPIAARGRTQTTAFIMRCLFMFIADFAVSTVLNSAAFGGEFGWSVSVNAVLLVLAFVAFLALLGAVWLLREDKVDPDDIGVFSGRARRLELWRLAQSRVIWQLLLFAFMSSLAFAIAPVGAGLVVATQYVHVDQYDRAVADFVKGLVYTASLWATQRYLCRMSWPKIVAVATCWIVGVRVVVAGAIVFNLVRYQFVFLYFPTLAMPAGAARFLVLLLPIAEIAQPGFEATTYGVVITFYNFALLLAAAASKRLAAFFALSDAERASVDTVDVRWKVMAGFLSAFAVQFASLTAVMFLPRQRLEVQQLRYYGGFSAVAASFVVAGTALALTYSIAAAALSAFTATACLRLAGGNGC